MAKKPSPEASDVVPVAKQRSLRELALFFLRLGTTAFGGPAGHIAMMEHELVRRREWLTREKFLDLLGASNLIPGLATLSAVLLVRFKINSAWLVLGVALVGLAAAYFGFVAPR